MRRLGVLGGTFDPVHEGHAALARAAIQSKKVDGVILLPMARPAHREAIATPAQRLQMCCLAVEGEEKIFVSQAGMASGVKYTTDTLGPLSKEYPHAQFTFIIGADKLPGLPYWYQADKLFAKCDFLCFPRMGVDARDAMEKARRAGARIDLLTDAVPPCTATMIRLQTAQYEDAPGLHPKVLCYMAENGLYQPDLLPKIKSMVNPRRFQHILGVRKEAVRLAALHGVAIQKAALAALLHDCAKGMPVKQMAQIATEQHLVEDENMLSSGAMLHGPVGAYVARQQFGIRDEDVLNAIRNHTVGRPGMSPLELCIFVADATEPGREEYDGLKRLREMADVSLPVAALTSIRLTREYLERTQKTFFPIVNETIRYLEGMLTPDEKALLSSAL